MVEKKLVDHILNLESRFFEMTVKEVKKLAYDFAEEAKIPHNFNKEKKSWAGLVTWISQKKSTAIITFS